ncbi:cytochrome c oxidase subunit II [Saprospiraceae bacterium]|nr:cytochrome c oxidase subunit II [Saprospiraceae bacterium]
MLSEVPHIFQSVSDDSDTLNWLFFWFFIASGIVLLSVAGLITYIVKKFGAKERKKDIPQKHYHDNRAAELIVIGVSSVIVLLFLFLSVKIMWQIQSPIPEGKDPDLIVTGHQWWWEVSYPGTDVVAANEIHIPAGERLLLRLESADVIHNWWVPALGRKMDMIPGITNHVWIQAREPGTYEGMCSEFCGAQHAWMRMQVVAHEPDEFKAWQNEQSQSMKNSNDALVQEGAQLFKEKTCATCHTVKGWSEKATIGPDLTHVGSRYKILGGKEINSVEALKRWIDNPQDVKPGVHMPNFLMTEKEVNAIATWLYSLK